MTPGTQVLAPQRVTPLAYTPGIVVGDRLGLTEVKMPHQGKWLHQCFHAYQLLIIDNKYQSNLLT